MLAQITRIFDFLMNRLNMSLQISLFYKLMITQVTRIFDFLMDRLNMNLAGVGGGVAGGDPRDRGRHQALPHRDHGAPALR